MPRSERDGDGSDIRRVQHNPAAERCHRWPVHISEGPPGLTAGSSLDSSPSRYRAASSRRSTSLISARSRRMRMSTIRRVGDLAADPALDQPDHRAGIVHGPGVERQAAPPRGADEAIGEDLGVHAQPLDVQPAGVAQRIGHQGHDLEPGIGPPGLHQPVNVERRHLALILEAARGGSARRPSAPARGPCRSISARSGA